MKILWFSRHAFPSPRGDKFQLLHIMIWMLHDGFRPLTGINFNYLRAHNTNLYVAVFPSPHGDKFQHERVPAGVQACGSRPLTGINFNPRKHGMKRLKYWSFRPLTGINFNASPTSRRTGAPFPSPHGDKFQHQPKRKGKKPKLFPSPHGDKFQLVYRSSW